jgi:hypothetical protein
VLLRVAGVQSEGVGFEEGANMAGAREMVQKPDELWKDQRLLTRNSEHLRSGGRHTSA